MGATADVDASSNTGSNYASKVVQVQTGSVFYEQLNDTTLYNVTTEWMENACHTKAHLSAASWVATADNNCRFVIAGCDPLPPTYLFVRICSRAYHILSIMMEMLQELSPRSLLMSSLRTC